MLRTLGAVGLLVAGVVSVSAQTEPKAGEPLDAAGVFKKASAAVVTIVTPSGFGSGVIVDPSGVIATNLHVVRGDLTATVTLASHDAYDDVEVVAVDARKDLVLLKVKAFKLPTSALGDSDELLVGNTVYAIGAPQGLELTFSNGIVSGLRDSGEGYSVIQTSAAISTGSSGGGLFNSRGDLVGITTYKMKGGENLNFAVPVNYIRGMLATAPKMTLAELAVKHPGTDAAAVSEGSTATPISAIPRLGKFYINTNGSIVLFQDDEGAVSSTWTNADGSVYGQTTFEWDARKHAFLGDGTLKTVCGPFDRRVIDAEIREEIYIVNDRVIRDRWTRPTKVNCSKGVVESYSWQERVLYAPER